MQKIKKGQFKTVKIAGRPSHSPRSLGGVVGGLIVNDWATSSINPFPRICTITLERAAEAYARMLSGDAQFRVVLTM